MLYYKLYLQTKEGKFISAYMPEYSLEYELGKHYTWLEMKSPEFLSAETKRDYPDIYWAPIFGLAKASYCIPFLKGYFPCNESLQKDLDMYTHIYCKEGTKTVIVECKGELWDIEEPAYGKQDFMDFGPSDEILFKSQTILRVVEEISKEQIRETIVQAHKEKISMKTIKDLQKVLACMKLMQAEGNQDDVTPILIEQLKAFDTVISAVENFEGMSLEDIVVGLKENSVEYLMKTADETVM